MAGVGGVGCGGRRVQQGQPDRVGENTATWMTPAAPLSVSELVAGSASGEAPKSLPEALGWQGDGRVPPEAQVEQRLPRPKNTQQSTGHSLVGIWGQAFPKETCPPQELT